MIGRPKFGNKRTYLEAAGRIFDSKHEADCARELLLREAAGEVRNIRYQVSYPFVHNGVKIGSYTADFVFEEKRDTIKWRWEEPGDWREVVADAKSPPTRKETAYRLRVKMMLAFYAISVREM